MTLHVGELARSETGLEVKFTALAALSEAGQAGRIKGYASRFNETDRSGDVVAPGAFGAALERLKAEGRTVKFLWQHDPAKPIGVWSQVIENANGLWVSGGLLTDLQLGREAAVLIKAGADRRAVDRLSRGAVAAQPRDWRADAAGDRPLGGVAGHLPHAADGAGACRAPRARRRGG